MKTKLESLAESFVNTDSYAVRNDVVRLGGVRAAADYCADMAIGQPDWEDLATDEGREALYNAIQGLVSEAA